MTKKQILITSGVVAGLIGLGALAYYLNRKNQMDIPGQTKKKASEKPEAKTIVKDALPINPKKQKADPVQEKSPTQQQVSKEQVQPTPKADEFPLRLGSKGKRVERLQVWLMRNYGWTGKVSGEFDKATEEKLLKHLKSAKLDEATYQKYQMDRPVYEQLNTR